jgi:hypothetical protein
MEAQHMARALDGQVAIITGGARGKITGAVIEIGLGQSARAH